MVGNHAKEQQGRPIPILFRVEKWRDQLYNFEAFQTKKNMQETNKEEVVISVENLVKRYAGVVAVDNISFRVKAGEVFAFLGPNGAGKTTTIKILTTLTRPTSGRVTIGGFDPSKDQDEVRRSFGIVFQDQSLDEELTARENMSFHAGLYGLDKQQSKQKIEQLLKLFELWERKNSLVKSFSGGMKRRLEIARCLLHEPKILFLDEPTLGLDPQTRARLWEQVLDLNSRKGMTVFLTTHYIEEAEKMANRVAIIDQGKILINASTQKIKEITKAKTLEGAFLELTGREIRHEQATGIDRMRQFKRK